MSTQKIKWGILSTANIGVAKVIPAIQQANNSEVVAICSRNMDSAKQAASRLGISKAYSSYEELLADPEIDAIYNPLPNHMHVEWTIKCLEAGKHVLCEKPLGIDASEVEKLISETSKYPKLKVMEAFMYRFHPQWLKAKELVDSGAIGVVRMVQSLFTYHNVKPNNIRNRPDAYGGGLMDIGCYTISFPRFIFDEEPSRVVGLMEYDPDFETDRLSSGLMEFSEGKRASFTCSTQLMPHQRCMIMGTSGSIEIEIPVNAPHDQITRIFFKTKELSEVITFEITDQYTLQAEAFAQSVLEDTAVPTPLTDALNNMKVIDAIVESNKASGWVKI